MDDSTTISKRMELATHCSSRDWSKAIRILDSLLSQSYNTQDICNRAYCYSHLELNKHAIKDCDKALELEPGLLQAYILKGYALSALRRIDDAMLIWEQGYSHAVRQSSDLKLLIELKELLASAKQSNNVSTVIENSLSSSIVTDYDLSGLETPVPVSPNLDMESNQSEVSEICSKETGQSEVCSELNCASAICSETNDMPEVCSKTNGISENCSGPPNGLSEVRNQQNGTSEVCEKPIRKFEVCSEEPCSKPEVRNGQSNELSESRIKSMVTSKLVNKVNGEAKKSLTGVIQTRTISLDLRLSRAIQQVNEGKYAQAISVFHQLLKENPTYSEALIGRGTAYAFQRELLLAIADFTEAIKSDPSAGEAWKRRGQARAALGESLEAIEDLTRALEFEPKSLDILHERGIVNFKFKDYNAAVKDLSSCVMLDKANKSAYTYLGLALSSIGDYERAEEAHLKSVKLDKDYLEARVHLAQFYQDLANTEKAMECLTEVLRIDERFPKAYHLRGLLYHGMGDHRRAIKDFSTGLAIESSNIECLYLRASCYHAVAEYREAVKDYDAVLELELDSMEKFVLQCLAFYQKEVALYTAAKLNTEFCWFDIDDDIDPLFKEYWCKKLHPKYVCEKVFRQPPLRKSLRKGRLRKHDLVLTKQKVILLQAADSVGKRIQYNCPGFFKNRRQHRMAGLAAIEIAQKVSKAWRSEWKHSSKGTSKNGKKAKRKDKVNALSGNRGGVCCSTTGSFSELSTSYGASDDRSLAERTMMSWRDVYSLAVKWRQISEPSDPVLWVDKLSEEFNSGFGSQTPLVFGQAKVVRYYPNYPRVLNIAKSVIKENKYVNNSTDGIINLSDDGILQNIMQAESYSDIYQIIGEDFWLATYCSSTAFEGKRLEGTRITLQKMGENGFDFAIKTPSTPSRWDEYDAEMTMHWQALCSAYCSDTYGSTDMDVLENVRESILRMTYYWYNFMPLSRGSAVVGYTVLLGLLLAANMKVTENIPEGLQVDWEAILTSDPNSFVESVKPWLYSSLKIRTSWKDYPDVATTLDTTSSVISALSAYDDWTLQNSE